MDANDLQLSSGTATGTHTMSTETATAVMSDMTDSTDTTNPTQTGQAVETSFTGRFARTSSNVVASTSVQSSGPKSTINSVARRKDASGNVRDATGDYKGGSKQASYKTPKFSHNAYNDTLGYNYELLINHKVDSFVVACADGNMYAFAIDGPRNEHCTEMWSSHLDTLVSDGSQRLMHYYSHTMDTVGVSRLRLEDSGEIPNKAVIVVWIPYATEPDADGDDYLYLAADPDDNIFYPMVCVYKDTNVAKLFLAKDPEKGAEMLKSAEVQSTVTGAPVQDCFAAWLMQGYYEEDDYQGNNGGNGTEAANSKLESNNSERSLQRTVRRSPLS